MKSIFGKFNPIIDELIHLLISIAIAAVLKYFTDLNWYQFLILVSLGLLIDLDHFLNPLIGRIFNVKATIIPSKKQNGVTVKIFHGIDLFMIFAIIYYIYTEDIAISIGIFLILTTHHLWDYIVYDHTWKELFLITRTRSRFKPGTRKNHVGIIFDTETLPR